MSSADFIPVRPVKRSAIAALVDVVFAIFMRELKTRFGDMKLGVAWLLLEPIAVVLIFSFIYSLRAPVGGAIPLPMMILTGLLAFKFWRSVMTVLSNATFSNRALFSYRQVRPLDCVMARSLLEILIFVVTYVLLLIIFGWYGFDTSVDDILKVLVAYGLLFLLAAGLGMSLAVLMLKIPDVSKVIDIISMPLMLMSGAFFTADMIPQQYWPYLSWNPVFHAIEMGRDAFFVQVNSQFVDYTYLTLTSLCVFTFGLVIFQLNKAKFVAS